MPCRPRKVRTLLKEGKAKVVKKTPFTIQLLHGSSGYKQPIILGVDSGYANVGLSAVTDKKELFASEVKLRTDIVKLISERRMCRRTRRSRKTWYRQPRFLNRVKSKKKGWLAPSIQHKFDSHIKIIDRVKEILPITKINVEVAAFDIQRIKNPEIAGAEYQQGEKLGFWNTREYVLYRDNHTCQSCNGKSKDPILNVHHIKSRQIGGDRSANLITLCKTCHQQHHKGEIKLKAKQPNGFKAETFMSMVRWKIVDKLRELRNQVNHTYGYITKNNRIKNNIPKSHINDAFVIAGGEGQEREETQYLQKQVRKNNRKLFKGIRSHIRNTAERFIHGFQRFDKVLYNNIECFIFGRRKTGYFDIRELDGNKIHASAVWRKLKLLESSNTMLIASKLYKEGAIPPHPQVDGVSLPKKNYEFGLCNDDVQISVYKLRNSEDGKGFRSAKCPNQILYMEKPIVTKKNKNSGMNPSVWWEFHSVGDLPAVVSDG